MKHLLLTTIAAVVLVGCGKPDGPLIQAAKDGSTSDVRRELANGADVNAHGEDGLTALHYAASYGPKKIFELLITKGADVNAKAYGGTPLHLAAIRGHKEIAELLIDNGADVNAQDVASRTPLDVVIEYKQTETADLLRKHGGKTGEELKAERE